MTILFSSRLFWPDSVKGKLLLLFFFLLIFIPVATFFLQKKSSKPPVANIVPTIIPTVIPSATEEPRATTTPVPESKNTQKNQKLVPPPFYPGLSWTVDDKQELGTDIKNLVVYYSSENTSGHFGMPGKEWVGVKQKISQVKLNKMEGDFINYYNDKLTALGWASSIEENGFSLHTMAADGPRGGIWGYIKVENGILSAIILEKETPTSLFTPEKGSSDPCPCDITFRMFVSYPQDLTKVLPTSL